MSNDLEMLEKRIEKAIKFIEEFKNREKKYLDEKKSLEAKISFLREELEKKEEIIEELKRSQRYLKEKIETILDKLESIELMEDESMESISSSMIADEVIEKEITGMDGSDSSNEEKSIFTDSSSIDSEKIIEEESTVDLREYQSSSNSSSNEENQKKDNLPDDTETVPGAGVVSNEPDEPIEENTQKERAEEEVHPGKSELELIDGGVSDQKELLEESLNTKSGKSAGEIDPKKDQREGFLFNTGSKIKDDWYESNPFIEI